ncbi:MAG: TonB-dependent receptor domain-containing protein [Pseudomonadales bacterium]
MKKLSVPSIVMGGVACAITGMGLSSPRAIAAEPVLEEIIVTGSYIRRTTADSPSPLTVIGRSDLEEIGAIEIADVVNRLTFNSGAKNVTDPFSGGDASAGDTNINIRNLGLGATLVLLDGKRTVASSTDTNGNTFVPLSTLIPTIGIERMEIIKDGASALYGSDAIAGVVNVISRQGFEGVEFSADYRVDQETRVQEDITLSGIWGLQGERGSLVVSAEFLNREGLRRSKRIGDFGKGAISTSGFPGNFVPVNPAMVGPWLTGGGIATGIGGPVVGDLDCEVVDQIHRGFGNKTFDAFRSPLPQTGPSLDRLGGCISNTASAFHIVGEEERFLSHASAEWELSEAHTLYGSVSFSDQDFTQGGTLNAVISFPVVPNTSPGLINDAARRGIDIDDLSDGVTMFTRPLFQEPTRLEDVRTRQEDRRALHNEWRVLFGARGDLPVGNGWYYDTSFNFAKRRTSSTNQGDTKAQNVNLAVNGFGGQQCDPLTGTAGSGNLGTGNCFYFNPFASSAIKPDGTLQDDPLLKNPESLLRWMIGDIRGVSEFDQKVFDAVVAGDLVTLPNGLPLGLAVGVQYREESAFSDADADSNSFNFSFIFGAEDWEGTEKISAVFAELAIPVTDRLEFQLAGRYESFDELGESSFDPKLTMLWNVRDDLTLRASTGTSFRAGSLRQRFGASTQLINVSDVAFSNTSVVFRPIITRGNLDLTPEEAFVWNVGFSWAPDSGVLEGLSVDADFYYYDYDDLITAQGFGELLTLDVAQRCPQGTRDAADPAGDPGVPLCGFQSATNEVISIGEGIPQVVRGADLKLIRLENDFVNAQSLETSGLDLSVGYRWSTSNLGMFNTRLNGSWTRSYDLTLPSGAKVDGVGSRNFGNSIGRTLPEFRVNASLGWMRDRHSSFVQVRYIDSYENDERRDAAGNVGDLLRAAAMGLNPQNSHQSSMTVWDAQYTFELPGFGAVAEGSRLTIGGNNIFNRKPPRLNFSSDFDPFVHDPRGAVWYARYTMQL